MGNLKEKLNKKVPNHVTAFIILLMYAVIILGSALTLYVKVNYTNIVSTSANAKEEGGENQLASIENLTNVENINSIEELQKLNEKEIEETKEKDDDEKDKNTKKQKIDKSKSYYIKVNYKAQVVTIYKKDSKGNYTVPVKAMVCSTGTYTPTGGIYKVPAKIRWCRMVGDVYGQYCTQIVGNILFHSVPYATRGDHSSLLYQKYDQLGSRVSLGCVRLTCADAKWIYDNCSIGTQVEFYSSSNPGPLGKPTARKISNAPKSVRGWDPTDPVANNPWKKYLSTGSNKGNKKEDNKGNATKNETVNNTVINEVIINDTIVNDTIIDDVVTNTIDQSSQENI